MIANQLFYRVLNDRTIIVAADNTQKRTQYEEQVIRTFFVSHADATELSQLLVGADPRRRHGDPAADRRQQDHQHASPSAPPRRSWRLSSASSKPTTSRAPK